MSSYTQPTADQAAILSLGTAVPHHCISQAAIGRWMSEALGQQPALTRWIDRLYKNTGIETRYSCIPDVFYAPQESRFSPGKNLADIAGTAERMAIYERVAVEVGTAAARQAITTYRGSDAHDPSEVANSITHLIAVSCTGFFAPGLDQMIARNLQLPPHVERIVVGFMGCAAAFNALRLASQIVRGQPEARVLIVCVELCSLHVQPGHKPDDLVGAALFADGAGACLVGTPHDDQQDIFELRRFYTELTPEAESFMVWRIGDYGHTLRLSSEVPAQLAQVAPGALQKLFDHQLPHLDFWAIHPGGRAILDRLADIFALAPEYVEPSRATLRNYGNISSPTIFFVLQEYRRYLRRFSAGSRLDGVAMAFGPGLVIELMRLVHRVGDDTVPIAEPERSAL